MKRTVHNMSLMLFRLTSRFQETDVSPAPAAEVVSAPQTELESFEIETLKLSEVLNAGKGPVLEVKSGMAAEWEEIRRLAADFQRAQFAETVQRLSERNCIEIVAKLVEEKSLEVVHTLDGKEYVTPAQISREIRDELYMHRGRINVVDLQKILNVDLVHVEGRASEIARTDRATQLVLGQLIDETYLDGLAEEVNDKLQEAGRVNISELCKIYDLPGDFLIEELNARLGRVIQGQIDPNQRGVIFTQAFLSRHKARVCGIFSAITRPTQISSLLHLGFQENLLYSVLEELVNCGRLKGSVVGVRQDKSLYVPDIYSKAQSTWVESFLKQNGYLEFDALSRLRIPDPINYIRKRFKSSNLLFLKSACIGQTIMYQLEASVEEAINSATWVDLQPMIPSSLSDEDVGILLNEVLRSMNVQSSARLLSTFVVSEKFLSGCIALFDDIMQQKAQKEVKNNPVFLITEEDVKQASVLSDTPASSKKEKRDERRKKAAEGSGSIKGGGGGNAREIRIRKTKKKGRKEEDSDEETPAPGAPGRNKMGEVSFLSVEEIMEVLEKNVCDGAEEMLQELAEQLQRPLSKLYQEVVTAAVLSTSSSGAGGSRKKNMKDLQEEINNLYNNIRLFEKGTRLFSDETQTAIAKHVLKTVCTDVTNMLLSFMAGDHVTTENSADVSSEVRLKILAKLSDDVKAPLMKLHNSLNGKGIEDFLSILETSAEQCGLLLKKGDKKRERQALFVHRQALLEQLRDAEDPALVLHLTSVLLFQSVTHSMLHAPGRCVPHIIAFLKSKISEEQHQLLSQFQALVVQQLLQAQPPEKKSITVEGADVCPAAGEDTEKLQKELQNFTRDVKDIMLSQKKASSTE
ncbi:hypothetical protein DNTS_007254 [Danionella cerebrum]|uniref:E3 UFM1-protein ligase 1 n=1 Tax=Danionella cerebrum TaxID=2873325 RepID=A0A553NRE6_9TELE|nr:hypothetical protein DNTS_007254 [Danionella translucida]